MTDRLKLKIRNELIVGKEYLCYVNEEVESGYEVPVDKRLEYLGTKFNKHKFLDRQNMDVVNVSEHDVYDNGVYIEYCITKDKIKIFQDTLPDNVSKSLLSIKIEDVVKTMYEKAKAAYVEHL